MVFDVDLTVDLTGVPVFMYYGGLVVLIANLKRKHVRGRSNGVFRETPIVCLSVL